MKHLLKTAILLVVICFSTQVMSQAKLRFGHIDSNELLKIMPGKDSAQTKLQTFAKTLENQLKIMNAEFETKYQEYLTNEKTWTELIKADKQKELQGLQERIQNFQTQAQESLKEKETELLQPIIDKAKKAIEEVAKENAFTYIFDSGVGVLLYDKGGEDILPLVKKKLNITK